MQALKTVDELRDELHAEYLRRYAAAETVAELQAVEKRYAELNDALFQAAVEVASPRIKLPRSDKTPRRPIPPYIPFARVW